MENIMFVDWLIDLNVTKIHLQTEDKVAKKGKKKGKKNNYVQFIKVFTKNL